MLDIEYFYLCSVCGTKNEISIDESMIEPTILIEDCTVCCNPNTLKILFENNTYLIINLDLQ